MYTKGKNLTITSAGIRTKLMAAVQILGKGQLCFGTIEMGAHSLHSEAAVEIYLAVVTPLTITIIRRW